MNFVGKDDGHGLLSSRCRMHADISHKITGSQDSFEALEGDVLEVVINRGL